MTKKLSELHRKIERIKDELATIDDLRRGSLNEQFNVCGTPGCKCKADPPQKHGPYYQLSFTRNGKSTSAFVRRNDVEFVTQEVRNYQRVKELVDEWVELGTQLAELRQQARND